MSKKQFDFNNLTDVGKVRDNNEDYYAYFHCDYGECFLLCDGAGGYEGGEAASQLSVETMRKYIESTPAGVDPVNLLLEAIEKANTVVRVKQVEVPELKEMKTTCVAFLLQPGKDPKAWIAYVGDSRIYRIRRDTINQLSHDHSKVMEMVDHGLITKEQARNHPQSNIITRAIGAADTILAESKQINVYRDDRFIMCSDGVSDQLPDDEIFHLTRGKPGDVACKQLIARANNRGGPDNSTIQIIDVLTGPKFRETKVTGQTPGNRSTLLSYILAFICGFVLAGLLIFFDIIPLIDKEEPNPPVTPGGSTVSDSLELDSTVSDSPVQQNLPEDTGSVARIFTYFADLEEHIKDVYPSLLTSGDMDTTHVYCYNLTDIDMNEMDIIRDCIIDSDNTIHLIIEYIFDDDLDRHLFIEVVSAEPDMQNELCLSFGNPDAEENKVIDITQDNYEDLISSRITELEGSFVGIMWILLYNAGIEELTSDNLEQLVDINNIFQDQEVEYFKVCIVSDTPKPNEGIDTNNDNIE